MADLQHRAMTEAKKAQARRECEERCGHMYEETGEEYVFPDGLRGNVLACAAGCGASKVIPWDERDHGPGLCSHEHCA